LVLKEEQSKVFQKKTNTKIRLQQNIINIISSNTQISIDEQQIALNKAKEAILDILNSMHNKNEEKKKGTTND